MTIDELLKYSPEELASFTDAQILEWFKEDLKYTRPELVEKEAKSGPRKLSERGSIKQNKFDKAREMAKQLGIDLDI